MSGADARYDLIGLGEVMLRLAARPPQRLEQASELDVQIGGTEANVMAACARLGLRTAFVSALPSEHAWGDRTVRELRQMLELRHALRRPPVDHDRQHRLKNRGAGRPPAAAPPSDEWEPPILKVVAARDQGLDPVMEAIAQHREFLERTGQRAERERARARMQFLALLRNRLLQSALDRLEAEKGRLDEVALAIARREADPYALAETLAHQLST